MKKLLVIILLAFSLPAFSQYTKFEKDAYFGKGVPTFNPAAYPAIAVDTIAKVVYWRQGSGVTWGQRGGVLREIYLPQDIPSFPNPISTLVPYLCPQAFGAIGADRTFLQEGWTQEKINNTFPGIMVNTSDNVDWACLQYCFYRQKIDGKPVFTYGKLYMGNDDVICDKDLLYSSWYGGMVQIYSRAANVIRRATPAENGDANVMINAQYHWQDIYIRCQNYQQQTGIKLFSVYPVKLECVKVFGANKGFNFIFCLQGVVESCEANQCIDGAYLEDGTPYYSTTKDLSQNNVFTINSFRTYMPTNGRYGIYIASSNDPVINSYVGEGFHCNSSIMINGNNSSTVKEVTINYPHVEHTGQIVNGVYTQNPVDVAAFNIEMSGGLVTIIKPFGQHPTKMVRAKATTGYLQVYIGFVTGWLSTTSGAANPTGKMFENAGGVGWYFDKNDGPLYSESTTVNTYCTPVPRKYNGPGTGDNSYIFNPVAR